MAIRYAALGPLLSEEGSRAFLGLRIVDEASVSPCALIWAPEEVLREPERVEFLRRDTARASVLEHPNIVRVFGLVELEEGLARAVEYADAESLRRILKLTTRLPANLAARVVLDAALGVQYAHLAGNEDGTPLVHADLRPETLLVSYSGATKVSGYGALAVAPVETGGRRVIGRRRHCAPEQILGGRAAVSQQTDIYLLGALLYETLTGEVPFQNEKNFDKAVVSKPPALLDSALVPQALRPVIGKAMAKKGNLRFATVQAFREAVEEGAGGAAEREEVAAFLASTFKEDDARQARQREIDRGLQEWKAERALAAAAVSASRPPAPSTSAAPPPPEPAPSPAPQVAMPPPEPRPEPRPELRPVKPAAPEPRARVAECEEEEPPPRSRTPAWLVLLPVAAAAAAAFLWFRPRPSRGPERPAAAAQPAPEKLASAPPAESAPSSEPAAPPSAAGPGPEKESSKEAPLQTEAGAAAEAQPPATGATLEVATTPPLMVALDGQAMGRSPLSAPVAPGRHRLTFSEPSTGLQLARTVDAKPGANRLVFTVGKGAVTVEAPSGCEVRIDGRVVGRTPLPGPVPVFEGSHRIQVKLGSATWQQAFRLREGEQMRFDVETDARDVPQE